MQLKEKNLLLLALAGPIMLCMCVAAMMLLPLDKYLYVVVTVVSMASLVLAMTGFVACMVYIFSRKNTGRPKLQWVLLGLLNLLLVFPVVFGVVKAATRN